MRRVIFVFFMVLFIGAGCVAEPQITELTEKFSLTDKPQAATFMIGTGWTGGMGSMPVLDWGTNNVKTFDGAPIYFDEKYREKVESILPTCYVGTPRITISETTIILTKVSSTNDSIEDAPTQTYYQAVASNLPSITVQAEECAKL